jgi:hypothetical protein
MDEHLNVEFPTLIAGNSYRLTISLVNDDNSVINAAGSRLWLTIKDDKSDEDSEAHLQFQYLVPDNVNTQVGEVEFTVPPEETKDIYATSYYVDLQTRYLNGDIFTVSEGRITVVERVTKALNADETPPVLYLPDARTIEFPFGAAGLDHNHEVLQAFLKSALALDQNDGVVTVANDLFAKPNPLLVGNHTIAFNATDAAGNAVTGTRLITVAESSKVNTAPVISNVVISIPETMPIGSEIGEVVAVDAEDDSLTFAITSGNTGNAFAINSSTGVISTATALDYETLSGFTLTVTVSDGSVVSTSTVVISITDVQQVVVVEQYSFDQIEVI